MNSHQKESSRCAAICGAVASVAASVCAAVISRYSESNWPIFALCGVAAISAISGSVSAVLIGRNHCLKEASCDDAKDGAPGF